MLAKWIRVARSLIKNRPLMINLIVSALVLSVLDFSFPFYFKLIIDNLLITNYGVAMTFVVVSFVTSLIMMVLGFSKDYLQAWLHNKLILDTRKRYYSHLLRLPVSFFLDYPTGKITQRVFEDVDILCGTVLGGLITFFVEITRLTVVIIVLAIFGFKFLFLFAVMATAYCFNYRFFKQRIEDTSRVIGVQVGALYSKFYDVIPGIREVKNFSKETRETQIFVHEHCELFRTKMTNFVTFATMNKIGDVVPAVSTAIALGFCVIQFREGALSIGMIVLMMSYLQAVRGPVEAILGTVTNLKQNTPVIDRINEILLVKQEQDLPGRTVPDQLLPSITFKAVNFSYPNSDFCISNFDLRIEPGMTVALVGATGSGKSTLINLLLRHHPIKNGQIQIGDRNISEFEVRDIRKKIAVVPQHPHLFFAPIANNIMYALRGSTLADVQRVCKEINFHDYILSLPEGYNAMIGERGVKLSGGQRQLIAIARAMLRNAPILILDEATSSLDSQSEKVIQGAITKLMSNKTTIAIAHRLSTIINADMIVVMKNGQIIETGSHASLLDKRGLYSDFYREQFKSQYTDRVSANA